MLIITKIDSIQNMEKNMLFEKKVKMIKKFDDLLTLRIKIKSF